MTDWVKLIFSSPSNYGRELLFVWSYEKPKKYLKIHKKYLKIHKKYLKIYKKYLKINKKFLL